MKSALVIARRLNKRLIELDDETRGEAVGVLKRNGEPRYVNWLGFMDADTAKTLSNAKPVKVVVARIGLRKGVGTEWTDVPKGHFVQGCLVDNGVYGVVDAKARMISRT